MNISTFLTNLKSKGIARPNLFEVTGVIGPSGALNPVSESIYVRSASVPPSTLGEITVPYRGRVAKIPGDRTFDNWSITVISDEGYDLHNRFLRWANSINGVETNVGEGTGAGEIFGAPIYQDWQVSTLAKDGSRTRTWNLVGCWPISIGAIEVAADSNDSFAEFTVDIAYQYYTTEGVV